MHDGHPELIRAIADEITRSGPIPFARFMELALYHPQYGYYMRASDGPGAERIGWSGDYYTSADVHPFLARALARQVRQVDDLLGHPDPFTVVEMGPGKGLLARDFLADCQAASPSLWARLRYVLIERSPAMRASQYTQLAPWAGEPGRVAWLDSLDELAPESVTGAFMSNELVDALPVHRITMESGTAEELYVDWENARFCERRGSLSTPALTRYLDRLAAWGITLPDGYTTEINLAALTWMKRVARALGHGVVITIDYGHTAQDLYGPERRKGTLLCYHRQLTSEEPYRRVGEQDLTAHVDFSTLAMAGDEAGLQVTGFTNQMSFLIGLGVEQALESLEPGSREFQALQHLLRPEGMGRTFKVLIQHKGFETPQLDGLRFKPFFGKALAACGVNGH
jgi:SAM-dependent MidA family methyltransferase